jgi:signal transduction histidine kinase
MTGRRILLVEDERIVALDVSHRLQRMGLEVVGHAADAQTAIRLAEEAEPDLILMDIQIAGDYDGITTAELIHERAAIPVVFLTAYDDQELLNRAKTHETFGYVLKPFQERELSIAIDMALYKSDADRELRRAKEDAERAVRAKADFLAAMSHELRTPLNSVIGMADLAGDLSCNDTQEEYLRILRDSAETLLLLINSILDFSKIDAGMMVLTTEPFALHPLLERVVSNVVGQAVTRGLELDLWVDPTIPTRVTGDAYRLMQVLINLLANAVKFTAAGRVELEVTPEQDRIRFSVTDTGCGIPEADLQTIFDLFTQLRSSSGEHTPGTGIGLALCKRLVTLMGGEIRVRSRIGEGSVFWFSIPLSPEDDSTLSYPSAPAEIGLVACDPRLEAYLRRWLTGVTPQSRVVPFADLEQAVDAVGETGAVVVGSTEAVWMPDRKQDRGGLPRLVLLRPSSEERNALPRVEGVDLSVVRRPLRLGHFFRVLAGEESGEHGPTEPVEGTDACGESTLLSALVRTARELSDRPELDELKEWLAGGRGELSERGEEEVSALVLRLLLAARRDDRGKVNELLADADPAT